MMKREDAACSNCSFSAKTPYTDGVESLMECRATPPQRYFGPSQSARRDPETNQWVRDPKPRMRGEFPLVLVSDWCGKYRPGESK